MNEPNPPPLPPEAKRKIIWPWVLLQFLPAVTITIGVLLSISYPSRFPFSWQTVGWMAFLYCYLLSFLFFRSRGRSIPRSLLFAAGMAVIVLAANVVLIFGIVFFGCLVL